MRRTIPLVVALLSVSASVQAVEYELVDLGLLPGGLRSWATDINEAGVITGYGSTSQGLHAFVWEDGALTDLGVTAAGPSTRGFALDEDGRVAGHVELTGGTTSNPLVWTGAWTELSSGAYPFGSAMGVSTTGRIVGQVYEAAPGDSRAAYWDGADPVILDPFGGDDGAARAINDAGVIVGWADSDAEAFDRFGFRYDEGTITMLGPAAGFDRSDAYSVNELGVVCGVSSVTQPTYPFQTTNRATRWAEGIAEDLGTLDGFSQSWAHDLDDAGTVVGAVRRSSSGGEYRAVRWTAAGIEDLNALVDAPGWELQYAYGVNGSGQIVGAALVGSYFRAFLLDPVTALSAPEASGPRARPIGVVAGNPQRASGTVLSVDLDRAGAVRVDVLDVTGRHIRTLADDTRRAGTFELVWDGTDAGGAPVPGGVYFVRMVTGDGTYAERIVRP